MTPYQQGRSLTLSLFFFVESVKSCVNEKEVNLKGIRFSYERVLENP
ncbi:hypothetical protein [Planococcus faecalis]|nr:hypothetical protein [Planococcus faecalis]